MNTRISSITGQNKKDYHLITTTHPYLIELGLGSFTIPSLVKWWNEKGSNGFYLHRTCINNTRNIEDLTNPVKKIGDLLGISTDTEFSWKGWKPNKELENAGVYKKYDLSNYDGNVGGDSPWEFASAVGSVTIDDTLISDMGNELEYIVGGELKDLIFQSIPKFYDAEDGLSTLSPIYDVVNLNRYMSDFYDFYPRSVWDKDEPNSDIAGQNTKALFASHEFLADIKTSKNGPYIEWSGDVTFYINEGHLCDQGITENIAFKLHLFDESNSDVSDKTVTIKSLKYVAPRRDVTGKLFGKREDGTHTEYDADDPSSKIAGDIDLYLNPISKNWESGSPVLFAIMTTDLAKKPNLPPVDHLETSDISEDLDGEDFDLHFIGATGTAMPIRPQNGNPLQWQPNYLEPEDVRCKTGSKEKETLTVWNFSTQRQFSRGDEVMLTRIDNVWHVSAMGVKLLDEDADKTPTVGKWGEFTYMMTNSQFLFKDKNGVDFTPREAELSFHSLYYNGDELNGVTNYGTSGGWDKIQPFNTENVKTIHLDNGYAQTTSFDYLDSDLCGIRNKVNHNSQAWEDDCSISTTSATINAAGHNIPGPTSFLSRNAAHSSTFFGCLFPEGYVNTSEHLVGGRGYEIIAQSIGTTEVVDTQKYVAPKNNNSAVATLSANDGIEHRNNCRQPALALAGEVLSDSNNSWTRYSNTKSASLFYDYVVNKDQSCRQFPADVMTNASPAGLNGSPLYPVHRFKYFHTEGADKYKEVSKAFLQGIWLGKKDTDGTTAVQDSSAFDFLPIKRNTLQFRPLKMEGYIQFGDQPRSAPAASVQDLSKTSFRNHRTGFSIEAHRTQWDDHRPCTAFFEDRETHDTAGHGDLWDVNYGLKWGGDIADKNPLNDRAIQRTYNYLHEFNYWSQSEGPTYWVREWRDSPGSWDKTGGNAYGVITTFNTVTANDKIDFSTDNLYGMGAGANGKFTIGGGYPGQNNTWGVSQFDKSYRQENILDLSIRIYQQHPREQTLYDPRTFAVHHFNPDVRYANDEYMENNGEVTPHFPEVVVQEGMTSLDASSETVTFSYNYWLSRSEVDLRVITRYREHLNHELSNGFIHSEGTTYTPEEVPNSHYVFSDATHNETTVLPPVMPEKFWYIDTVRTGKLLPFKYKKQEVGIPVSIGRFLDTSPIIDTDYSLSATDFVDKKAGDILGKMCVKNPGSGYVAGDIVGLESKGVSFKVVSTRDDEVVGAISVLECVSRGTGFSASQASSVGDTFTPDTNGPIEIETLSSEAGEGFDAYFVSVMTYDTEGVDPKPYLMKKDGEEITRIAADQPKGTHQNTGHSPEAEAGAFITETHGVSYTLDPTLYSSNKEYDIFFHFHNDITMTWMASSLDFHGDLLGGNYTEAHEQHITVNINPR